MPPVFKKLTSVIIWILFITGCLAILTSFGLPFGGYYAGDWERLAIGVLSLFMASITIKFKKTIE